LDIANIALPKPQAMTNGSHAVKDVELSVRLNCETVEAALIHHFPFRHRNCSYVQLV
jgi:hypothetical protein